MNLEPLIRRILSEQTTDWHGIHGLSHWGRVYTNGLRVAEESGANKKVVELFAFFHDSKRWNDGADIGHGARGAEFARRLRGDYFDLSDEEFELLYVACRDHTEGETEADVTIQTCWDADRLDLGRVWIVPDPERLCTEAAKRPDTIDWAHKRAEREIIPQIVAPIWHERREST